MKRKLSHGLTHDAHTMLLTLAEKWGLSQASTLDMLIRDRFSAEVAADPKFARKAKAALRLRQSQQSTAA